MNKRADMRYRGLSSLERRSFDRYKQRIWEIGEDQISSNAAHVQSILDRVNPKKIGLEQIEVPKDATIPVVFEAGGDAKSIISPQWISEQPIPPQFQVDGGELYDDSNPHFETGNPSKMQIWKRNGTHFFNKEAAIWLAKYRGWKIIEREHAYELYERFRLKPKEIIRELKLPDSGLFDPSLNEVVQDVCVIRTGTRFSRVSQEAIYVIREDDLSHSYVSNNMGVVPFFLLNT